jgi:hypothetical protein
MLLLLLYVFLIKFIAKDQNKTIKNQVKLHHIFTNAKL